LLHQNIRKTIHVCNAAILTLIYDILKHILQRAISNEHCWQVLTSSISREIQDNWIIWLTDSFRIRSMRDLDQQGRERARNDLHERLGKYDLLKVRVFPPRHLIPPYSQVFIRNW